MNSVHLETFQISMRDWWDHYSLTSGEPSVVDWNAEIIEALEDSDPLARLLALGCIHGPSPDDCGFQIPSIAADSVVEAMVIASDQNRSSLRLVPKQHRRAALRRLEFEDPSILKLAKLMTIVEPCVDYEWEVAANLALLGTVESDPSRIAWLVDLRADCRNRLNATAEALHDLGFDSSFPLAQLMSRIAAIPESTRNSSNNPPRPGPLLSQLVFLRAVMDFREHRTTMSALEGQVAAIAEEFPSTLDNIKHKIAAADFESEVNPFDEIGRQPVGTGYLVGLGPYRGHVGQVVSPRRRAPGRARLRIGRQAGPINGDWDYVELPHKVLDNLATSAFDATCQLTPGLQQTELYDALVSRVAPDDRDVKNRQPIDHKDDAPLVFLGSPEIAALVRLENLLFPEGTRRTGYSSGNRRPHAILIARNYPPILVTNDRNPRNSMGRHSMQGFLIAQLPQLDDPDEAFSKDSQWYLTSQPVKISAAMTESSLQQGELEVLSLPLDFATPDAMDRMAAAKSCVPLADFHARMIDDVRLRVANDLSSAVCEFMPPESYLGFNDPDAPGSDNSFNHRDSFRDLF